MNPRENRLLLVLISAMVTLIILDWGNEARSQEKYPTKPIDIIVSYAAGGGVDLSARLLGSYMSKKWGVPVNVINKPGGNHVPALVEIYRAAPNGYSLIQDSLGSSAMLPISTKNLPFDVMNRTFIGIYTSGPMVLSVPPASPLKNLKDLEMDAKKDPGSFTWTSMGGSSPQDYTMRKFLKVVGVDVFKSKPIMSQGASQAVILTAGGNVKVGVASLASSLAAIKSGTIRPLAITSKSRASIVPDLPTTAELGYPAIDILDSYGPSGPPNLPAYVVDTWNKAMEEMLKNPEITDKMKNMGLMPDYHNSIDAREHARKKIDELKELFGQK